ncbi:hypothetical protein CTEN210_01869 [Chaetoceros tenuissimus]|uniref:ATP-dependent DNA helicase n=1 Tax=Chaetoceros tenuissimus TaxID=426638 RepID=A0AAD3H027_9STRA|nr:hypothetical protein CTEN210_01869 [Chaetoceros tenuissimus]
MFSRLQLVRKGRLCLMLIYLSTRSISALPVSRRVSSCKPFNRLSFVSSVFQQQARSEHTQIYNSVNPFGADSPFQLGNKADSSQFRDINQAPRANPTPLSLPSPENHVPSGERKSTRTTLEEELKRFRTQQSEALNCKPYSVITNASLEGIVRNLPTSEDDLLKVPGIGPKKSEMFGSKILLLVSTYKDQILEEENGAHSGAELTFDGTEKHEVQKDVTKPKIRKTQLKEDLREYRKMQAEGKPTYTVFTNAALDGIYACLPRSKAELLDVKGIGPKTVEKFGDDILEIVSKYVDGDIIQNDPDHVPSPPPPRVKIDAGTLTKEQLNAANIVLGKERRNCFITGSAGTGKSYLLKYLVQELREQKNKNGETRKVGIAASTGVAAVIVGGSTLHSFFGIGIGGGSISSLLNKVRKNKAALDRIDEIDALIIDEVSMMSSELLEKLDVITREVRRNGYYRDQPFGGIQIIAFGDFYQLPPVTKITRDNWEDRHLRGFCFESEVWKELGLHRNIIELQDVQRQEDEDFIKLLNKVRIGEVDTTDIHYLNSKCLISDHNPLPADGIVPTRLYVLNRDVDEENITRLQDLDSPEIVCKAVERWRELVPTGTPPSVKKQMQESLRMELPDEVRLKVGAQVMLTRNKKMEDSLVNGSRGVVERFVDEGGEFLIPVVRFDNGIIAKIEPVESFRYNPSGEEGCLVRMQIPLKLAWAVTVHKSQGSTLSRASLDLSSSFEFGSCYTALSRVKSLEGLWLEKPVRLQNIMVSQQVTGFFNANKNMKKI